MTLLLFIKYSFTHGAGPKPFLLPFIGALVVNEVLILCPMWLDYVSLFALP